MHEPERGQRALRMFTKGKNGAPEGDTKVGTWRRGRGRGCERR
jgi:hypothetical protein